MNSRDSKELIVGGGEKGGGKSGKKVPTVTFLRTGENYNFNFQCPTWMS